MRLIPATIRIFFYAFFCFLAVSGMGQNLIPNPSFETITNCPNDRGQIDFAPPWFSPNLKTVDLFHDCGTSDWTTGNNNMGSQTAPTGQAYAGIRVFLNPFDDYREYLSTSLTDTLEAGKNYTFSFKINFADGSQVSRAIDRMGVAFSATVPTDSNNAILPLTPQYETPAGEYIKDQVNWIEYTGCYHATGDEFYMTIGNFRDDDNTNFTFVPFSIGNTSFYYVDDVSLEEITDNPVNLGNDTTLCDGNNLILFDPVDDAEYLWNTGSASDRLTVFAADTYSVQVTLNTCVFYDTIVVDYQTPPVLDLGNDTMLCVGDTISLMASIPSGTYEWSDGLTGNSRVVTEENTYTLTADDGVCTVSDDIFIDFVAPPVVVLGPDTLLCEGTPYVLDASWEASGYTWQDGTPGEAYTVTEAGSYWVEVSNLCGSDEDTVTIDFYPYSGIGIPNVITPNGDGINDRFIVSNIEICTWNLEVYNRWGEMIYKNEDYDNSWEPVNIRPGIYYYTLNGNGGLINNKGWIQVLK